MRNWVRNRISGRGLIGGIGFLAGVAYGIIEWTNFLFKDTISSLTNSINEGTFFSWLIANAYSIGYYLVLVVIPLRLFFLLRKVIRINIFIACIIPLTIIILTIVFPYYVNNNIIKTSYIIFIWLFYTFFATYKTGQKSLELSFSTSLFVLPFPVWCFFPLIKYYNKKKFFQAYNEYLNENDEEDNEDE